MCGAARLVAGLVIAHFAVTRIAGDQDIRKALGANISVGGLVKERDPVTDVKEGRGRLEGRHGGHGAFLGPSHVGDALLGAEIASGRLGRAKLERP